MGTLLILLILPIELCAGKVPRMGNMGTPDPQCSNDRFNIVSKHFVVTRYFVASFFTYKQ